MLLINIFPLPLEGVLISLAVERSASPYDSNVRGPRKSLIFGESGGIERFQLADRVLRASIAEREVLQCHLVYSSPKKIIVNNCLQNNPRL